MYNSAPCAAAHDRHDRHDPPTPRIETQRAPGTAAAIAEHRRFVVELARKMGRGRVDPEDLAQEVLERWWRLAPSMSLLNPRGWMTIVVRRLMIDRLRRRRTAREVPVNLALASAAEREAPPWWDALDAAAIEREIAGLPPAMRRTFELFTFEARSYQEIASQLHVTKSTVGVRLNRARALLKRRLTERWSGPR